MEIRTRNSGDNGIGLAKHVVIKSFRQVTIFGNDYTKIVYRHSEKDFSIEKIEADPSKNVQVISGPRAEEIIVALIETEEARGSTFVWTDARFESCATYDPLMDDFVETEDARKKRKGSDDE